MTLTEFITKYGETAELDTEIEQKLCQALGLEYIKPKPKTVWDLEFNDPYWYLDEKGVINGPCYWESEKSPFSTVPLLIRNRGNVFLTEEEAKAEAERRAVETLLLKHGGRREWKPDEDNMILEYNGRMLIPSYANCPAVGGIYFDGPGMVAKALREVGEERLVKALFRTVEE